MPQCEILCESFGFVLTTILPVHDHFCCSEVCRSSQSPSRMTSKRCWSVFTAIAYGRVSHWRQIVILHRVTSPQSAGRINPSLLL